MSTIEKTKSQQQYEAVIAYMDANPGSTIRQAAIAVAEEQGTTDGAVQQGYRAYKAKLEGTATPRKRSRSGATSAPALREPEPTHPIVEAFFAALDNFNDAASALRKEGTKLASNLKAHEAHLGERDEALKAREAAVTGLEQALAAFRSAQS